MNASEIRDAINHIMELGDMLDNAGGGVHGLSDGRLTTKDVFKTELAQFLLYIADGSGYINDSQAAVLSLVIGDGYSIIPAYKIKELASTTDEPDPEMNLTFTAFAKADEALSQQNGQKASSLVSLLISMYESMGQLMVSAHENTISQDRYDRLLLGLKTRANLSEAQETSPKSSSRASGKRTNASNGSRRTTTSRKATSGNKSTSAQTTKKAKTTGNRLEVYNDSIRFELPNDYLFSWEEKDDGTKTCNIHFGENTDEDGNTSYEFSANVTDTEISSSDEDTIPAGEEPFQTIHRRDPDRKFITLSTNPNAEFEMKETPVNILGRQLKFFALLFMIQISSNKVVSVMRVGAWDDEDNSKNIEAYRHMIQVARSVRYEGSALPDFKLSAEQMLEQLKPDFDGKSSLIKGQIGLQIKSGDKVVSETVLTGDDDGNVHHTNEYHAKSDLDGDYPDYIIKDGGITGKNKKITSLVIPEGVTSIDDDAFKEYKQLTEVVIPNSVKYISNGAFDGCVKLVKINLPEGITQISSFTFNGCKALLELHLPESVKRIGWGAFSGCAKLASINLPDSISYIAPNAFNGCASLIQITLPEGIETIESGMFWGCKKLETVIIPDSVTTIDRNAFNGCKKLKNVKIPSRVKEIGSFAFNECSSIKEIVVPEGVEELDDLTFSDCTGLTSVVLPKSLKRINDFVFNNCKNLKRIEVPSGVEHIGTGTFGKCAKLKEAVLPEGLTEIADSLFNECTSLSSINIPESVETIGDQAFNACAVLSEVVIPDQVKSIGMWAFDECEALKTVSMPGRKVQVEHNSFPDEAEVTYRRGKGRTTKRQPGSSSCTSANRNTRAVSNKKSVGKYTAVMPTDDLYSHYGKLKREHEKFSGIGIIHVSNNGKEHEALPLVALMERQGNTNNAVYKTLKAIEAKDHYALKDTALLIAQVFRVEKSKFDSRHDDEGDIGVTMLEKKWQFSALRSFAWTLADLADREGKSIDDYDIKDLIEICRFIEDRQWLNYEEGTWFDSLCGHPDIHVFYMPQQMIDNGLANGICSVFNDNPIVSLDAFRNDLALLKNAMIRIHNYLLENRDRSMKLDSPEAAVLKAWCSMVMSAETSFFSEDGPMMFFHSYPSGSLNVKALPLGPKAPKLRKTSAKQKKEDPSSVMDSVSNYEIVKGADGRDRIKLGEYPAGAPITWLVLEKKGQELFLLSEYALDAKPFCEASFSIESTNEWQNCTLRAWLNEDFYTEAFSSDERKMIVEDAHDTYKKGESGDEETPSTTDKVFLLSAREANKYLPQQKDRICRATAFAKEQGAEIESGPNQCSWWLRSPAVTAMGLPSWTASVRADGTLKAWGLYSGEVCVRPVIKIKSSKIKISESHSAGTSFNAGSTTSHDSMTVLSQEDRETVQKAQEMLTDIHSQLTQTSSALEKHAESLRKKEEEKKQRAAEAKKKGKSSHNEVDMLAVLLIEEAIGKLDRDENEFATVYAEDFAAYNEQQLIRLRRKILPTIHDAETLDAAKEDMLSRPVKDRFSIATGNYFNVCSEWDFDKKGIEAIEKTKLWYRDNEMDELNKLMDDHKESTRQSVFSQLTTFRSEWSDFFKSKGDLIISIEESDEPVPEAHSLFHVILRSNVHVRISLSNPSVGYLTIPVMNVFASCWKVSPEAIWDAALKNKIDDNRGTAYSSQSDALSAKAKALAPLKPVTEPGKKQEPWVLKRNEEADKNKKRKDEIRQEISRLQAERDSVRGLFGGFKRKKIQKQIDELYDEMQRL